MENFIYDYFINPIWSHSGYNVVNTFTYALIAIAAVYAIYYLFKKANIVVDRQFILSTLPFILLGSTARVVTDAIDTGVFKPVTPIHTLILQSHFYDYGYLTVTPGIYVVVGLLFLATVFIMNKLGRGKDVWKVGALLWLPNFLLLLPFMQYWIYAVPVVIMALIPFAIARWYFKDDIMSAIVFAHALDGAATFVAIDVFSKATGIIYSEQHVFSGFLGIAGGSFLVFYFVKVIVAFAAVYLIKTEQLEQGEKDYIALVLIIMGLAPGIRDILRMIIGG
ncbi:MAG: DUF63 family protein [Candidatus Micrarchaeota archaeon]